MKVTAENYEALKGFFGFMCGVLDQNIIERLPPDQRPISVLEGFESHSKALARRSLAMGLGDTLEQTQRWSLQQTHKTDAALRELGLPTLTEVRLQFSRKIASIMSRGKVRSEIEYYALRNVVEDMPEPDRQSAWGMLGVYENGK